jgi:pimeloyl-ACP methyl ester carboxylesterase
MRWIELAGPDPCRVYLHGLGAAAGPYFTEVAARRPGRSLLVDLLGHGLSDRPRDYGYTLEEHADSVAALLASIGVTGAEVVGHSLGGAVGIVLAHRHPALVRSLIVVEPNLDPAEPRPGAVGSRGIAAYSEQGFLNGGFEATLRFAGPVWAATMRLTDPVALHRTAVGLVRGSEPTMRRMLLGLTVPRTLVEGGDSEPATGIGELRAAGVRHVVVPKAAHNVMLDNPAGFVAAAYCA